MFKMMKENCFVRHLDAAETMGQATTICTDKTGTLTYNKMSVVRLMVREQIYSGEGSGDADSVAFNTETLTKDVRSLLVNACCINSNAFIKNEDSANSPGFVPLFVGSATEGATLILSKKFGSDYKKIRSQSKISPNGVWSFSAERKRMSTLCYSPGGYILYCKGAAEIVLQLCSMIFDPKIGKAVPITITDLSNISATINKWAAEGLRTIVLAYKTFEDTVDTSLDVENDLVFISLLAIKDPIRREIPEAVNTCMKAGMIVRMVTGDNILTATKIGAEANIFFGDGIALEGPVFRKMSRSEKIAIVDKLQVEIYINIDTCTMFS